MRSAALLLTINPVTAAVIQGSSVRFWPCAAMLGALPVLEGFSRVALERSWLRPTLEYGEDRIRELSERRREQDAASGQAVLEGASGASVSAPEVN